MREKLEIRRTKLFFIKFLFAFRWTKLLLRRRKLAIWKPKLDAERIARRSPAHFG